MNTRIYVRASTKEQDAERALDDLRAFANNLGHNTTEYIENHTGTKLERPQLNKLLVNQNTATYYLLRAWTG